MNAQLDDIRISRYIDKLNHLKRYYQYTKKWFVEKDNFLIQDTEKGHQDLFSVYHAIQLSIEVIIDLSAMIVKDMGQKPLDNYKNLRFLQDQKIQTESNTRLLYNLIGLRNRITQDYNGLIDKIALDSYTVNYQAISDFISGVEKWINPN